MFFLITRLKSLFNSFMNSKSVGDLAVAFISLASSLGLLSAEQAKTGQLNFNLLAAKKEAEEKDNRIRELEETCERLAEEKDVLDNTVRRRRLTSG